MYGASRPNATSSFYPGITRHSVDDLNLAQRIAVWLLPVLFGITVHEVAHGWVAKQLGDPTAMMLGRLTLNPVKHIDPVGTILVPGILLLVSGMMFGWAKPVPVTWENLKRPKRDMALVALAGPGANLVMAIAWALLVKLGVVLYSSMETVAEPLIFMGIAGIFVNTILLVLNLLPLPPLDGGRVLAGMLPNKLAWKLSRVEPYGLIILLALLFTGMLGKIIWPVVSFTQLSLSQVAGIPQTVFEGVLFALLRGG